MIYAVTVARFFNDLALTHGFVFDAITSFAVTSRFKLLLLLVFLILKLVLLGLQLYLRRLADYHLNNTSVEAFYIGICVIKIE
jgi:hypothetical protein